MRKTDWEEAESVVVDWSKIRKEYIQGGVSYRALAVKYGVPLKNLARRAKDENWVDLREQANHNAATKTVEKVSSKNAEIENGVYDAARELLAAFRGCVSSEKKMTATRLKDYGAALKSIQSVLTSAPTELDIREQEERRWIPVTERLPDDGDSVIVVVSGKAGNVSLHDAIEFAEFSTDEGWILEMWPEWEDPKVTF